LINSTIVCSSNSSQLFKTNIHHKEFLGKSNKGKIKPTWKLPNHSGSFGFSSDQQMRIAIIKTLLTTAVHSRICIAWIELPLIKFQLSIENIQLKLIYESDLIRIIGSSSYFGFSFFSSGSLFPSRGFLSLSSILVVGFFSQLSAFFSASLLSNLLLIRE